MSEGSSTGEAAVQANWHVAPSPHVSDQSFTTRRMMIDVLIGLAPALIMSVYMFRFYAVLVIGLCTVTCLAGEILFVKMRGRKVTINDCSAVVTGIILGMSLPWNTPWFICILGALVAIGLGKVCFGGIGFNIFNPAMVGRAFIMLSFAAKLGGAAYQKAITATESGAATAVDAMTQATPLTAFKETGAVPEIMPIFLGTVNGSLGEISALALLLGGIYLCLRKTASWEIPVGTFIGVTVCAFVPWLMHRETSMSPIHHLCSGAVLLLAFFIATDPVTSPLTSKGKWIFGLGCGVLVMVLRLFSSYPEGAMFAVLLMNAATPLINRLTIPRPLGGPVPQKA